MFLLGQKILQNLLVFTSKVDFRIFIESYDVKFAEKAYSLGCNGIAIPFTNLTPYEIASDVFDFGENLRLSQPKCQLKDVLINDSSESLDPKAQVFVIVWKFNPRDLNDG